MSAASARNLLQHERPTRSCSSPSSSVWYDLNKDFGLNVNAGYMIARPDIIVETTTGQDKRTARADQFILKVGIVYSIF